MANQKTYTIEIAGVKESYESVSKLADVLDKLGDRTVKVEGGAAKASDAMKKQKSATDELGKATKKLQEFDAEYEKEVQKVKSELSAQKKEVSELIKQEQAQAVVDAKQLNSYADKQRYLTSLNKLIRTHANVTDEDKEEIRAMVEESAKLQAELKAFDEEMKIYTRNVGNYPGAAQMVIDANKSMKQQLREVTNEMASMLANGVDKTDPKFQSLAKRAGELKDAFADAQDEISHFASDTRHIDNVINLAQTATSVWGLYSNAMRALGIENEEVTQSMEKMMAVMSTLQELQALQNALTAQGSATMKLYEAVVGSVTKMLGLKTTATQADTAATNTSTVATKALSVALRAIPLMFIIGLVITLITQWESIVGWFKKTFPVLDTLGKKFKQFGGFINTVKAVLVGFGEAIVNWVTNPIVTLSKVLERLFAMDFKGAYQALGDGLKNQFKGSADAFRNGFKTQVEKGLEEISLKALKEGNKQTQQELAELKIRERNNKTYSKKYIELQKKDFEERKRLAKGNQEELNKIKLEEMQFDADCEDRKTAYTKEQSDRRIKIADDAAKAAKKAADEYKKKLDELKDATDSNINEANDVIRASVEESKKIMEGYLDDAYKAYVEQYAAVTTAFSGNEKAKTILEEQSLKATEDYLVKRKEMVIQTLLAEAEETKKRYQEIINETNSLIQTTQSMIETASGSEREKLEGQLTQLQTTLKKTTEEMRVNLGKYAEEPIIIPFDFNADDVSRRFYEWTKMAKLQGRELGFTLTDVFQTMLGTSEKVEDKISQGVLDLESGYKDALEEVKDYLSEMAVVANLPVEKIQQINDSIEDLNGKVETMEFADFQNYWMDTAENIRKAFVGANTDISQLGQITHETMKEINSMSEKMNEDIGKELMEQTDKVFSYNEKSLRKFQEAAKGLKLEIVNVDDRFTETFGGQIMSIEKTRERYEKLKTAYEEYLDQLEANRDTELWQKKLYATELLYGEDSMEYKLALDEKEKADAEYLMEYEKVNEQLREIAKKTNDIPADYAESVGNRIRDIYNVFNENLFQPLAEGFTALFDYQIEEAEKRLEEVEELLDKAVEMRAESESKIEEINNKLKESDQGNTEALKQQLADEMVLLVQREQNERELQKQKEREEALIQKKEKANRKIELGQKLIEGIVNTALGVTAALKYGPILGPIFAAVIGAMGALQTGIIAKQISKLEKGGKIKNSGIVGEDGHGRRHSQGGHRIEGTNIEVEMGEMVVNRRSTKKYEPLLTAINEDNPVKVRTLAAKYENGGVLGRTTIINNYNHAPLVSSSIRKFADGGQLNYGQSVAAIERDRDYYRLSDIISQIDFSPVVAVTDIERKQKNLVKVRDIAGK